MKFIWELLTNPSVIAVLNFFFISFFIIVGAVLGSTLRTGKAPGTEKIKILHSNRIGIGSAFICVPFIASFLHLNYQSLLLPLSGTPTETFVEQLFLLIALAGIASYLGYGLLDNIASKVLQSQMNGIEQEQKETKSSIDILVEENKKIKLNEQKTYLELLLLKAKDSVITAQKYSNKESNADKLSAFNKYTTAIEFLDDGLSKIDKETDYETYDRFMVMKAYILKRLNRITEALDITLKLLEKDKTNPILLYNAGCYLLLCGKHKNIEEVKDLIIKALTVSTEKDSHKKSQKGLIEKVLANLDEDIKDLFDENELQSIGEMTKKQS
ncbi:TPA: hypothetical protein N3F75_002879 [Klebsiella aerogenes]|nr:hypothetical protein [Klebsiella aerogenes]